VRERESIVVGGIRPLRASVGVLETGGDKVQEVASRASVDDRKGACGPERGARFLRGEDSEGRTLGGSGTKQGRETRICQETAEGLTKTRERNRGEAGHLVSHGASPGDVVEEARDPREPDPASAPDGREVLRSFKRERLHERMNLHRHGGGDR
jgi:hypothetical protein